MLTEYKRTLLAYEVLQAFNLALLIAALTSLSVAVWDVALPCCASSRPM
jgi:hypothetical protein